ncbi:MAG: ATP-binding cassette domain-containing protein [Actinobacteria bacterium]|uniref:Unannotated protein n=1 Tax=freshwater metagenome TaxID=449393 RepID=A0A6J7NKT7_9ZZZZ|nr:ATP-binding cassette domain-containing protein [Actinomycetota bacterium]
MRRLVDAQVTRGSFHLDVAFTVGAGETVALLGPNGAGKSTVLRVLAGLLALDGGRIEVTDDSGKVTLWDEPASDTFVSPERRGIGVVFQDYALFPNLSVLENVAFGLRARGIRASSARATALGLLDRVGLGERAHNRPDQLSGGQAQRVALARALAVEPSVLLLDEPLAALDALTRAEVRSDLRRQLAAFPGVRLIVTHDPVDAYALADRVVVLEQGSVAQTGTLDEVTMHPRSRYVADLVGLNLLAGEMRAGVLHLPNGTQVVAADSALSGPAFVAVTPQSVALHRREPEGSARNVWTGTVTDLDRRADRVRVRVTGTVPLVAEITPAALIALDLAVGQTVWISVKATEIIGYPA